MRAPNSDNQDVAVNGIIQAACVDYSDFGNSLIGQIRPIGPIRLIRLILNQETTTTTLNVFSVAVMLNQAQTLSTGQSRTTSFVVLGCSGRPYRSLTRPLHVAARIPTQVGSTAHRLRGNMDSVESAHRHSLGIRWNKRPRLSPAHKLQHASIRVCLFSSLLNLRTNR